MSALGDLATALEVGTASTIQEPGFCYNCGFRPQRQAHRPDLRSYGLANGCTATSHPETMWGSFLRAAILDAVDAHAPGTGSAWVSELRAVMDGRRR